ncbi:RNA pyrophosphohydrolase [Marilutibacter aestuarii]|uniref:RNA pyrophosphohydrolase n=2 Tax=Marilutibacter TaxID=3382698 RepID=A0A508A8X8_9GAMM|nr:RNA pyrophosphohydrolase [Lysobacter spongiae]TQD44904.1 RNA pyrophosphohydrolase [Lysobacter aestuarii]
MIDPDGYRPNVGIVLMRPDGRLFWARRVHRDGWQFPQGGMNSDETPIEAMYRELREETGLLPHHVEVLGETPGWLRYRLPQRAIRRHERLVCIGQKQVWFLLRLVGDESELRLDLTDKPEFDHWRWVDFWYPVEHVVIFKRSVYARALMHLSQFARDMGEGLAVPPPQEVVQRSLGWDGKRGRSRPRARPLQHPRGQGSGNAGSGRNGPA